MKNQLFILLSVLALFSSCIGDDIVFDTIAERISIENGIDSLQIDSSYQFNARFFNNIGEPTSVDINWSSSDESIISITPQGLATGLALGSATIISRVELDDNSIIEDQITVVVSENETVVVVPVERSGTIKTTSTYILEGSFTLREENGDLLLEFDDNYRASSSLPGAYVYLTNNPNTINNAFEIGKVSVFNGAHSYTISGPTLEEYSHVLYFCKPFGIKVGDGEIQ